jgi:hypothetical protein
MAELEGVAAGTASAPGDSSASDKDGAAEELADMREVLRLGRHLLEGRQVTL